MSYGQPLAYRMRPRSLGDLVGQQHIIGENQALYQLIQKGHVPSMLLYGPPGVGKTSFANAIAQSTKLPFYSLNATTSGKKDIEQMIANARMEGSIILFLDEIHRFNKLQQDTLLPHVENGSIILIGATTENPFHDVNPAIRSRMGEIKQLKRLTADDLFILLDRALHDEERGLGKQKIHITKEQLQRIAESVNGDARKALTLLESAVRASDEDEEGTITVEDSLLDSLIGRIGVFGDKKGSHFYNLLSALQKSVRGSDVDAALYYLAHLLESGDLIAVNRRLLVMAYEDIGLANPDVGSHVLAATEAAIRLGLPEGRIPLAQAVVEMCLAEKSNSAYQALDRAIAAIHDGKTGDIPDHLKDTHYVGAAELGHGGYQYPHDTTIGTFGGWVNQQYLPDELKNSQFYRPIDAGQEVRLNKIYQYLQHLKNKTK